MVATGFRLKSRCEKWVERLAPFGARRGSRGVGTGILDFQRFNEFQRNRRDMAADAGKGIFAVAQGGYHALLAINGEFGTVGLQIIALYSAFYIPVSAALFQIKLLDALAYEIAALLPEYTQEWHRIEILAIFLLRAFRRTWLLVLVSVTKRMGFYHYVTGMLYCAIAIL
jgi:hypothetical protein